MIEFSPVFPPLLLILFALLSFGSLFLFTSRSLHLRSRRDRLPSLVLRGIALLLLLLILTNPLRRIAREEKPKDSPTLVLLDTSQSMKLGTPSRLQQAKELLGKIKQAGSPEKIQIFPFAETLSTKALSPDEVDKLQADGRETRIAAAAKRAIDLARGLRANQVIICSDGQTKDKNSFGPAALQARENSIEFSVFPLGAPDKTPSLCLRNCRVERHVPANARVPVEIELHLANCAGQTVTLHLLDAENKIIDKTTFPVDQDDSTLRKTLTFQVGREDTDFIVDALPLKGETLLSDNQFPFRVRVNDPQIHVLYMEGSNHKNKRWTDVWEYDIFAQGLLEAGNIKVDILTVDEQKAEGGRLQDVEDEKHGFPITREALYEYDVVICSDINRSIFTEQQLEWTRDLVAERGGGFCMIGGYTAFGAGGWDQTVWEKMIPMDMALEKDEHVWEDFKPTIPADAITHPIWYFSDDTAENKRILEIHPPFKGTNMVKRAKPGATILAYWEKKDMPVISVQSYGRGRSMAFTSDAAGGWGERYQTEWGEKEGARDNRYYRRFWLNAVRWLAENSTTAHHSELVANLDAAQFHPGETVTITARRLKITDENILRTLRISAKSNLENSPEIPLKYLQGQRVFQGKFTLPEILDKNQLELTVTCRDAENKPCGEDQAVAGINHLSLELSEPEPDHDSLLALSELTGGEVIKNLDDLQTTLKKAKAPPTPNQQRYAVPAWDRLWLWGLILLCLTLDWLHRKAIQFGGLRPTADSP